MLERNYKIDNIRFIAMFLVVFSHMIELFADCEKNLIYRIIYSFHMPLFIFISGYVAKFDKNKIFKKLIPAYLIFQTIYKIFDCVYIQGINKITVTYSNPYWFLWYLFILIGYYLLIPIFDESIEKRPYIVLLAFAVALFIGFDTSIGYELSLSRFISFLPFFLLGYYSKSGEILDKIQNDKIIIISSIFGVFLSIFYVAAFGIPTKSFYHVQAYSIVGYSIADKLMICIFSVLWIIFILNVVPNIRILGITFLGQNTFYVYLLQGFLIKFLAKQEFFDFSRITNLILSISIMLVFYVSCSNIEFVIKKIRKIINIPFFKNLI